MAAKPGPKPAQPTKRADPYGPTKRYPRKAEAQRRRWADPAYRERVTAAHKALWRTPEHREKLASAGWRPVTAEDWEAERARVGAHAPTKFSRMGIPAGMNRAEADAAWTRAAQKADAVVKGLEAQGVVEAAPLPDSDDGIAKKVMQGLATIAFGPFKNNRLKARALGILLDYTKAKPARRVAVRATIEEWLSKQQATPLSEIFPNNNGTN